jgi:hypothetical protein
MHESRIVLPPNAGVAELADALDSKSNAMLCKESSVAVSLPMATKPRLSSQDRARIVSDCRMTATIPASHR